MVNILLLDQLTHSHNGHLCASLKTCGPLYSYFKFFYCIKWYSTSSGDIALFVNWPLRMKIMWTNFIQDCYILLLICGVVWCSFIEKLILFIVPYWKAILYRFVMLCFIAYYYKFDNIFCILLSHRFDHILYLAFNIHLITFCINFSLKQQLTSIPS